MHIIHTCMSDFRCPYVYIMLTTLMMTVETENGLTICLYFWIIDSWIYQNTYYKYNGELQILIIVLPYELDFHIAVHIPVNMANNIISHDMHIKLSYLIQ